MELVGSLAGETTTRWLPPYFLGCSAARADLWESENEEESDADAGEQKEVHQWSHEIERMDMDTEEPDWDGEEDHQEQPVQVLPAKPTFIPEPYDYGVHPVVVSLRNVGRKIQGKMPPPEFVPPGPAWGLLAKKTFSICRCQPPTTTTNTTTSTMTQALEQVASLAGLGPSCQKNVFNLPPTIPIATTIANHQLLPPTQTTSTTSPTMASLP